MSDSIRLLAFDGNSAPAPAVGSAKAAASAQDMVLAELPGASERERLLLVLRPTRDGRQLLLHQQSWGEGVGWYTQHSVSVEPHQLHGLRAALGPATVGANRPVPQRPAPDFLRVAAETA